MKTPSSIPEKSLSARTKAWPIIVISLSAFILALVLRFWHINDLQFQFDEWLGGWHINPVLCWRGSLPLFVNDLWANVRDYVASGQTVAWSCMVELTQLITGPSVVSIRMLAALGGAFGAAVVALIGWRVFCRNLIATLSAAMVAVFSVAGIVFGQFADVYAAAIFASSLQLAVYLLWTRRKGTAGGWLVFSGCAFIAQLLMYTQLWITFGIFLTALWEAFLKKSGRIRRLRILLPAAVVYGIFSALHLSVILKVISWSESFRWYMAPYYPIFWKEAGRSAGVFRIVGYFLGRLYDLFNYHLALVFNPGIYRPLQWNWVSVPFLIVLLIGVIRRICSRKGRKGSYQLSVISCQSRAPDHGLSKTLSVAEGLIAEHADEIPRLVVTTLIACLLANSFFLIPFGGVRQMFFLLPIMALFYGWLVYVIINCPGMGRECNSRACSAPGKARSAATVRAVKAGLGESINCGLKSLLAVLLIALPILPFAISFPDIYRNRVSRLDLDSLSEALDRYQPQALVASEQNIQILEMVLNRDLRFTGVHWPEYLHPSDALDADFTNLFPVMRFRYGEREWTVHWVRKDYFPESLDSLLWIDMHISRNSRFEGGQMKRFYPTVDEVVPGGYRLIPLKEIPGNAPDALHQSIYWPPNSFYMYLIRKKD